MICFRQLKEGAVGRSSGLDVEGGDFCAYANDAVRQLTIRGNWWGTVQSVSACVRGAEVVWPRGVSAILGINFCDRPALISNHWYQFMQPDSWQRTAARDYIRNGWHGNVMVETRNTVPVFNPIKAEGFNLRTFVTQRSDAGKFITFYGVDVNGQRIITTRADGTVQEGCQVMMAIPYVDTPIYFRHVTRVVKDETDGEVIVYQHNVASDFLLDLARYQPTERTPSYISTHVGGHGIHHGACDQQVTALVNMEFVPFKFDDDLVQIDCEDAIRDMLLSIRKKEQGDLSAAIAYETSAFRELNFQMKHRYPDEQFIVNFRPFGDDNLSNPSVRIGMI